MRASRGRCAHTAEHRAARKRNEVTGIREGLDAPWKQDAKEHTLYDPFLGNVQETSLKDTE